MNKKPKSAKGTKGLNRKRSKDESESDSGGESNFKEEEECSSPPPTKKYSLRKRTAPALYSDYEYYGLGEDDDNDDEKPKSVEKDADFEADNTEAKEEVGVEVRMVVEEKVDNDLIDFEDMIHAGIVVNENNIDYDNLIQKTEIKLIRNDTDGQKQNGKVSPKEDSDHEEPNEESDSEPVSEAPENDESDKTTSETPT